MRLRGRSENEIPYNIIMNIAILGRQPKIGLAELESMYGALAVQSLSPHAAAVDAALNPARLGGILKVANKITELPVTNWQQIAELTQKKLPEILESIPEGKVKIGLSAYGVKVTPQQLFRTGLEIKKICRSQKRSARIVPNTETSLNSAAVLHNQLVSDLGIELVFIQTEKTVWLCRTTWAQDVDDYARRDFGRPRRDAFVGMLPPKLAQAMLNFAQVQSGERVLDPFCGTGVVLQEATLLGCDVYGTDISERMVDYSRDNLAWLQATYKVQPQITLEVADATNAKWQPPIDHIVCEAYLGQPLSGLPKPEKIAEIISDCNTIVTKFLKNAHGQLTPGSKICVAVPAWRVGNTFKRLPLLDRLEDIGYNRMRFQHATWEDLTYHREDQIVARELLVLTVK